MRISHIDGTNNKAVVVIEDNGTEHLFSYDTEVMRYYPNQNAKFFGDGKFVRVGVGLALATYSKTTVRHIKAYNGMSFDEYKNLPHANEPVFLDVYERGARKYVE